MTNILLVNTMVLGTPCPPHFEHTRVEFRFPSKGHRNAAAPTSKVEVGFVAHAQRFGVNPTREKPA